MSGYPSIAGYEIEGVLGEGGMGTVYRARQLSLNRQVAIKLMPEHLAADPTYVMRFRHEARAAARIKHQGIVQIFDAGEDHGRHYIVMEYITGETTAARLRRKKRLDEESALLIAESVAVALEHAWNQARLVHRDIKPDNILIDGDGTVKVADLGLAKIMDHSGTAITMAKMVIGTPHYCSPEQAQGNAEVDCRADIYALGATLYHFVTGEAPFAETSGVAAMVRNITDFLPDAVDVNPAVSIPLAWLIEKMMAKDRALRHGDWQAVLDDIDRVLNGQMPLSTPIPEGVSTVRRSARRGGRIVPAAGSYRPEAVADDVTEVAPAAAPASSRRFRVFLTVAAVFTVLLYALWFRMERARRRAAPAPEAPAAAWRAPAETKDEPPRRPARRERPWRRGQSDAPP